VLIPIVLENVALFSRIEQENIGRIQEEIDHFDRCKEKFDVAEMKASVALKNDEVDRAVQDLKLKKVRFTFRAVGDFESFHLYNVHAGRT
jgi:hypothetical protein